SGLNAWILTAAYGISVLLGLIVATIAGVKLYKRFQPKLARYEKYIPKIGAGLMVAIAILIMLG
ncbi:MAG: hypothetical protein Q8P00_03250, partial [Dehalococcoidia bacterium]|nr:hypothetical protein [Dehalococcoidia bacterium]